MKEPRDEEFDLCAKTKNQLDLILESAIDSRLADAKPGADGRKSVSRAAELTGDLLEHLQSCGDCENYQLANRVLTTAARDLPKLAGDRALTDAVMLAFDDILAEEMAVAKSSSAAHALSQKAESKNTYLMFAVSFIAFILVGSGVSAESIWSAGAWMAALLVVALLKPLLELKPLTA